MTKYATLIFSNPDGRSVLSHNRYILASDLATIARKAWISHAILNGVTDILQMNTKHTIPLAMITKRKSLHGFPLISHDVYVSVHVE